MELTPDQVSRFTPAPGRCIIRLDEMPGTSDSGAIVLPDSARNMDLRQTVHTGTVIKVTQARGKRDKALTYNWNRPEPFAAGDRVFVALHSEDLNCRYILTTNGSVWAMLEAGNVA